MTEEKGRSPELDAAEVEKFQAEAARERAEALKLQAEMEEAQVRTGKQRLELAAAEISLKDLQEKWRRSQTDHIYFHYYPFDDAVDSVTTTRCTDHLYMWHRLDPTCPVEICFTSPGGDVVSGLALFDTIQEMRRLGHRITTSTKGMAASMAGILLQAGDVRAMSKEAWVLIHEAAFMAFGKFGEVEDRYLWVKRVQARILNIFAARSKLTIEQLQAGWKRTDWWLDSDECLRYGLVDEVR